MSDRQHLKTTHQVRSKSIRTSDSGSNSVPSGSVFETVGFFLLDAIERSDSREMCVPTRAMIDNLVACEVDHNKAFIKDVLRDSFNNTLILNSKDQSEICRSAESTKVKFASCEEIVLRIFRLLSLIVLALVTTFSVKATRLNAAMSVRCSVVRTQSEL